MRKPHKERHRVNRIGWLRAAVLGANDGLVSTASLVVGVASAGSPRLQILLAGLAGLAAGAMSMAAGEYVSVSSQADTEKADLERERRELATDPQGELHELAGLYEKRGLDPQLALQVARQLTAHDDLEAHAREELGITSEQAANPLQAALTSAVTFAIGAAIPLTAAIVSPVDWLVLAVMAVSLIFLGVLGGVAAQAGGANPYIGAARVAFWSALAMGVTALVGRLFGVNL
jgi:VIT1/CCC1 family predicted Fe2+/Mn2+ transporter